MGALFSSSGSWWKRFWGIRSATPRSASTRKSPNRSSPRTPLAGATTGLERNLARLAARQRNTRSGSSRRSPPRSST